MNYTELHFYCNKVSMYKISFSCEHLNILATLLVVFEESVMKEELVCLIEMSLSQCSLSS